MALMFWEISCWFSRRAGTCDAGRAMIGSGAKALLESVSVTEGAESCAAMIPRGEVHFGTGEMRGLFRRSRRVYEG